MKRELADIGWWFDTSALTPDATAEQLVREVAARTVPLHARSHTRPEPQ